MVQMVRAWKQIEYTHVADALGDTPLAAIPTHLLRGGPADALGEGLAPRFDVLIVQMHPRVIHSTTAKSKLRN